MKKLLLFLSIISIGLLHAQKLGNVGINTETPQAALDIKAQSEDAVLRFTTKPSEIKEGENFVFFVGKETPTGGGYNLRRITIHDIIKTLSVEIPSLRKIVTTNATSQSFSGNENIPVTLDKLISNYSEEDYSFNKNYIELKKDGVYEISAWVGFEELKSYENDIIISLAKKSAGETDFKNFKRTIVSRTNNTSAYRVGNGIGSSFAFVENFKKGDQIRLHVNATYTPFSIKTLPNSVNLSITRVTKDNIGINLPN